MYTFTIIEIEELKGRLKIYKLFVVGKEECKRMILSISEKE